MMLAEVGVAKTGTLSNALSVSPATTEIAGRMLITDTSIESTNLSAVNGDLFQKRFFAAERMTVVRKSPWHSVKQEVYHDNTDCNEGNNIETENLRQGTGGKPKCKACERLD